jgi:hypothetical protein
VPSSNIPGQCNFSQVNAQAIINGFLQIEESNNVNGPFVPIAKTVSMGTSQLAANSSALIPVQFNEEKYIRTKVITNVQTNLLQIIPNNDPNQIGTNLSLSSDGTTIAFGDPSLSTIFIYEFNNNTLVKKGDFIFISGQNIGSDVSISANGNIVSFIGNNNNVYIYEFDGMSTWNQLGNTISIMGDTFEQTISLSANGDIVAFRSSSNLNIYVYQYDDDISMWNQLGNIITAGNIGDDNGSKLSLSASGTILAVGFPRNDDNGNNTGATFVFEYDGVSMWN